MDRGPAYERVECSEKKAKIWGRVVRNYMRNGCVTWRM